MALLGVEEVSGQGSCSEGSGANLLPGVEAVVAFAVAFDQRSAWHLATAAVAVDAYPGRAADVGVAEAKVPR